MLARSAQGLYWMGRYLERTDHLCRLLQLQTGALVDRPIEEIYAGWNRIYRSLDRQPPAAGLTFELSGNFAGAEEFTLADSYTLADDLTFERVNPVSLWSCFAAGRENARQMRHCISGEMWRALNLAYLRVQQIRLLDIWTNSPESFYASVSADIDTFMGVAATTMYRDEGWHFMRLGRNIERAQQMGGLLLTQLEMDGPDEQRFESDWASLLRVYHAFEAYQRAYRVEVIPEQVLNLLVTDPPPTALGVPRPGCRDHRARSTRRRAGHGRQRGDATAGRPGQRDAALRMAGQRQPRECAGTGGIVLPGVAQPGHGHLL